MLVNATAEFGMSDDKVLAIIAQAEDALIEAVAGRLQDAQHQGRVDPELDPYFAARSLVATLQGLQLAGRGGEPEASLRRVAGETLQRLTMRRDPPG